MNRVEQLAQREYVMLSHAMLCLDCEAICDVGQKRCPACGGGAFLTLARKFAGEKATAISTRAVPHV
jgi:hypothetical protein